MLSLCRYTHSFDPRKGTFLGFSRRWRSHLTASHGFNITGRQAQGFRIPVCWTCLENIAEEIRCTFCHGSTSELFIPQYLSVKAQPGCVEWGSCGTVCKFIQCTQPKTIVVELRSNSRQNNRQWAAIWQAAMYHY